MYHSESSLYSVSFPDSCTIIPYHFTDQAKLIHIQSDIHNRACVVLQEIVLLVAFLYLPYFSVNKVCLTLFSPWLSLSYLSLSTQIREELLLIVFLLVSALRWTHVLVSHRQTCSTKTTLYIFLFPQTWMVKLVGIWKVSNVYQPWLIFVPCKSLPDTVWPSSTKYYTKWFSCQLVSNTDQSTAMCEQLLKRVSCILVCHHLPDAAASVCEPPQVPPNTGAP